MRALADLTRDDTRVYFTGGATAVLNGWRDSTVDIDLRFSPDRDEILREIESLKNELAVNVELASPADFIPVKDGWEERSPFIAQIGRVAFHHFDLYAQALSKIERGHQQDLADVRAMVERKLIESALILEYFDSIASLLYRHPAIDAQSFRRAVTEFVRSCDSN